MKEFINNNKQTALDWILFQLIESGFLNPSIEDREEIIIILATAKALEAKQMREIWEGGINSTEGGGKSFEQFCTEFNKK
jgi:hypothetical protein